MRGISNVLVEGTFLGSVIYTEEGFIIEVIQDGEPVPVTITEPIEWTDGRGMELYPAFIDMHVHDRPDEPEKEGVDELEAACEQGGVGTICTMPNDKKEPFDHPDNLAPVTVRNLVGF
jgi:dihydroorotase-like cyclic amidohydrolase